MASVDYETRDLVVQRLSELTAALGQHFDLPPSTVNAHSYWFMGKATSSVPTETAARTEDAAQFRKERRISAVTFLNDQTADPQADAYGGGNLTFYGLLNEDPKGEGVGFPLTGQPGTLVAFPSRMIHSVSPVTHGKRYTITTWFV